MPPKEKPTSDQINKSVREGSLKEQEERKRLQDEREKEHKEVPKKFTYSRNRKNEVIIEKRKQVYFKPTAADAYVDKARAAAISFGQDDIKQSLNKNEQTETSSVAENSDGGITLMLGMHEIRNGNIENGVHFLTKAIEMNPNDQGALIARSKCLLQLGEPDKALIDAETALAQDKNSIRAIYQKAEALYFLGNFEHSLMFFHRGLRLRPELASFRLGVQKTQEAIENTIGGVQKADLRSTNTAKSERISQLLKQDKKIQNKSHHDKKQSRKLLGELFVDKEYLENLLKHPDLKRADTKTENISAYAKDAISFLNNRQEFWRQQKPTNILNC